MWSVIICSIHDDRFAAVSRMYSRLLASQPHEIIRIPDARSLAEGYNRGVRQSHGEAIIFSHDDLEIFDDAFAAKLKQRLAFCDLLGLAGTTRLCGPQWVRSGPPDLYGQLAHPSADRLAYELVIWSAALPVVTGIQALDGVLMCAKREVALAVPFDEQTFDGFHHYDLDFTFRAYQQGFKLGVCCDIAALHASLGNYDQKWEEYAARFMRKHGSNLAPPPEVDCRFMVLRLREKSQLLRFFNPPHFGLLQQR